jgi:hypothetical protein
MSNILTIAYVTEGKTDQRFLENIIRKTFEDVAFECEGEIEVYDPVYLKSKNLEKFVDDIVSSAGEALRRGINVLCVHVDADDVDDKSVRENKIGPALRAIKELPPEEACKILVAIIPIQMSESWMLADKELLKSEIGTDKSNQELGIDKNPEAVADAKFVIKRALDIAQAHLPRRRRRIEIAELYQPIGQKVAIEKLSELRSYCRFRDEVRAAFKELNYLQ